MNEERRQCKAVNSRGERDKMMAMLGSDYCMRHTPPLENITQDEDRLLKTAEVAVWLSVSSRTVDRLAQQGYLTKVKIYDGTRYRESEVRKMISEGTRRLSPCPRQTRAH